MNTATIIPINETVRLKMEALSARLGLSKQTLARWGWTALFSAFVALFTVSTVSTGVILFQLAFVLIPKVIVLTSFGILWLAIETGVY